MTDSRALGQGSSLKGIRASPDRMAVFSLNEWEPSPTERALWGPGCSCHRLPGTSLSESSHASPFKVRPLGVCLSPGCPFWGAGRVGKPVGAIPVRREDAHRQGLGLGLGCPEGERPLWQPPGPAEDLPLTCKGTRLTERTGRGHLLPSSDRWACTESRVCHIACWHCENPIPSLCTNTSSTNAETALQKKQSPVPDPQACLPTTTPVLVCSHRGGHSNGTMVGRSLSSGQLWNSWGTSPHPEKCPFQTRPAPRNEHVFK